ncbi:hypothetical protein Hamer_G030668 [Homarus americanus]|uniref:Uncharacterized protein n=1 Tax=Homarus americanus TaxID=6706 RepID=A0A8J5MZL5_HOMAM|nr:hypothetical protein Hamer_G030668 [Homarus americanus]
MPKKYQVNSYPRACGCSVISALSRASISPSTTSHIALNITKLPQLASLLQL